MHAVSLHSTGGSENLKYENIDPPVLKDGHALVEIAFCGINFIDTYQRTGLYKLPEFPAILGREASGTVIAIPEAENSTEISVGDLVCFACSNSGAYAEIALVPLSKLVRIPSFMHNRLDVAGGLPLQGMTAHYLTHDVFRIKSGDWVLIHAGAGGTGSFLIQMAKRLNARVITTVGSAEKAALALENGANHVILYKNECFQERVYDITGGKGVHVAYDSVGKETWEKSLKSLRPKGHLVLFGNASGPVPPIDPLLLSSSGSITLTRPTLVDYISTTDELRSRMNDLFSWVNDGTLNLRIYNVFPLEQANLAHDALESRSSMGKILLSVKHQK